MKKKYFSIVLTLFLLCALVLPISGCYFVSHPEVDGLSDGEVKKIRRVYYNSVEDVKGNIDRITVLEFLGDFDGKIVVKLEDDRYNVLDWVSEAQGEIIDGIFVGALSQLEKYVVYVPAGKQQKETVLLLEDAYKQGLVTKDDIAKIAENEQKIVGSHGY